MSASIHRQGITAWIQVFALLALVGCTSAANPTSADAGSDLAPDLSSSPDVSSTDGSATSDDAPDAAPRPCRMDSDCPAGGAVCDRDRGTCVQCRTRLDCPGAPAACVQQRCVPATMCASTRQCPGQVCDPALGFCVDCAADVDCAASERCQLGSCVARPRPCASSRQCSDLGLVCEPILMVCVECAADVDCLSGSQFCGAGNRCVDRVCTPGAGRCTEGGVHEVCDPRGSAFAPSPCTASQSCRAGECVDRVCVPGSSRCMAGSFNRREVCDADGLGYTASACAEMQSCRDGACMAQVCTPGSASCVGTGSARRCNDDGLGYGKAMSCPAMNACDARTGMCASWVCVPGTRSCEGSTAQLCNADGLGTTPTACGASQSCRAGACVDRLCVPGSFACSGPDTRRQCDTDGLGSTPAPCPDMNACLGAGVCTPWTCSPRSSTCASPSARRVCNADGQGTADIPCGTTEGCRDGVCRPRVCTPGATRCPAGNAGAVETCDAEGLAWASSPCAAGRSCSGGACVPWLCTPGTPSCVGASGTHECSADGLGYGATVACASGTSCTTDTGRCGAWICTPGTGVCDGSSRRVCNADGLGFTTTACTAAQTCSAGLCLDRVCTAGAYSCADVSTRRQCNATGLGYDPAPCPAMNACLGAGLCTPWTCTPGATGVCASATARQVCNADGQGYSSSPCAAAANATGACAAGACGLTCNTGYGNCDGVATNGCEVDHNTSAAHCGRCGAPCATGQTCVMGACRSAGPANDTCAGAFTISMTASGTTVVGTNIGADNTMTAPCSALAGADVFYRIVIPGPSPEIVYADTVGSGFDTVMYFARDCSTALTASTTAGDVLCNDDITAAGCASRTDSAVVARLTAGTWYLVVAGFRGQTGTINLRFQHLAVGGGALSALPAGSTTQAGATSGSGQIGGACGGASAGEATWWWRTCPEATGGPFSASLCSRAAYDTVMYLRNGTGVGDACNDDSCSLQSAINGTIPSGAGIHTLTVDGYGTYTGTFSVAVSRP